MTPAFSCASRRPTTSLLVERTSVAGRWTQSSGGRVRDVTQVQVKVKVGVLHSLRAAAMRRVGHSSAGSKSDALPSPSSARRDPREGLRLSRGRTFSDDGLRDVHTRRTKRIRVVPKGLRGKVILWTIVITLLLILRWMLSDFLLLCRFKLANNLDTKGWRTSLRLRKPPLLFVHSSTSVGVVWEANHLAADGGQQLALRWKEDVPFQRVRSTTAERRRDRLKKKTDGGPKEAQVSKQRPEGEDGWRRWIHSTVLEGLKPGSSYTYEIYLAPSASKGSSKKTKVLAKRTFLWSGYESASPDFVTDPTKPTVNPIHIACVGDNQFRLAVFARIFSSLSRLGKYLPYYNTPYGPRTVVRASRPSVNQPHLLLHVGDAVQNPHDLDQWQTDFWDPLTRGYAPSSASGTIPLLYARGNHDFDADGKNLYSAGLPRIGKGELNRTAVRAMDQWAPFAVPGTAEGESQFSMRESAPRSEGDRSTYHAYSPHPRCRILVLDSNLDEHRKTPGAGENGPHEVGEMERWLVWEMGRPEWKEASLRIVLVHVPPYVERWKRQAWEGKHEHDWSVRRSFSPCSPAPDNHTVNRALYVRTRLAPHWHGMSHIARQYEMPPASLVLSGHSHTYARGLLANFAAAPFFGPIRSSAISEGDKRAARSAHDTSEGDDAGVVYTIIGGAGGTFDTDRVERWGWYEKSVLKTHHFVHLTLDFFDQATVRTPLQKEMERKDGERRKKVWAKDKTRVYRLQGSETPCGERLQGVDRVLWAARDLKGKVIDRFVIEGANCRS